MEDYPLLQLVFHNDADPKLLVITDASLYAEPSVNPMLDIRLPGYTSYRSVPFIPNHTNTFTASTLGLQPVVAESLPDLPDGIYEIIYRMCPYETYYKKFFWLRDDSYTCQYLSVMAYWLDQGLESMPKTVSDKLWHAELYLEAAKAAIYMGYANKASKYYQKSLTYLTYLDKANHAVRLSE